MKRNHILLFSGVLSLQATARLAAQLPVTKIRVAEAKLLDAPATLTLVGTVKPNRRSVVSSEIAGIVMELPVRQGDRVEAGGVLGTLNGDALALRLADAKARLGALSARHQEWVTGTRPEELARLKALLEEAAADAERWKFEMDRIQVLYEGRESHAKEFTDTRANLIAAERRRAAAEAAYEMGVNGPRKETIAYAAFEVAEQQAIVDRLESDWKKTTIRAPFAGYVLERATEVGEWVPVGGPIVQMVDIEKVLVRVDVPESAFGYSVSGAAARVQFDALKRAYSGTIKHVIRQGDERARTFPVEVEVDNRAGFLAGGMFARVTVPSGPSIPVTAVPKDALTERGGVVHLALLVPGAQGGFAGVLVPVTVGADVADWISVTSTNVTPGTRVITHGNERLEPFPMPVEIVDADGNPISVEASLGNAKQPNRAETNPTEHDRPKSEKEGAPQPLTDNPGTKGS